MNQETLLGNVRTGEDDGVLWGLVFGPEGGVFILYGRAEV